MRDLGKFWPYNKLMPIIFGPDVVEELYRWERRERRGRVANTAAADQICWFMACQAVAVPVQDAATAHYQHPA